MRLQNAVRQFYFWMKGNGQIRTARLYLTTLEGLPEVELEKITPAMLQEYVDRFNGLAASTLNLKKAALRSFFRWAMDADYIAKNPARMLRAEKLASVDAKYFTAEQVAQFRAVLQGVSARDRLLFEFYLQTGCRLCEPLALNAGDVRGRDAILINGKGHKPRIVFLSPHLTALIASTLNGQADDSPLFQSSQVRRLSATRVQSLFKHYLTMAGIQGRFGVHSLRHTFATQVYQKTRDLRLTQDLLGHVNPSTTARYAHIHESEKRAAVATLF